MEFSKRVDEFGYDSEHNGIRWKSLDVRSIRGIRTLTSSPWENVRTFFRLHLVYFICILSAFRKYSLSGSSRMWMCIGVWLYLPFFIVSSISYWFSLFSCSGSSLWSTITVLKLWLWLFISLVVIFCKLFDYVLIFSVLLLWLLWSTCLPSLYSYFNSEFSSLSLSSSVNSSISVCWSSLFSFGWSACVSSLW